jgi:hypothetical protein
MIFYMSFQGADLREPWKIGWNQLVQKFEQRQGVYPESVVYPGTLFHPKEDRWLFPYS